MTLRSSWRQTVRIALGSFLGAGLALLGLQQAGAQLISGHDSNAPVNYAADRIELQDRQDRVVLSGNVDVTQGGLRVRAARMTVAYTDAGSLQIQRIDATGGVVVTRGGETARGDVAIYDFNREIITMVGDVRLRRANGDTLNGGRMVINLNSGVSSVDGSAGGSGGGGRVSGSFTAPRRD